MPELAPQDADLPATLPARVRRSDEVSLWLGVARTAGVLAIVAVVYLVISAVMHDLW